MKCPTCDMTLQLAERQGVEIDYCPQCRGVWLDRGELDKLIERASALETTPLSLAGRREHAEYGTEYRDEAERYRPRRRTSFLRELFDFD